MDKWLAQIGLKGRALRLAVEACEENLVDDLSLLQGLAKNEKQFDKAFPQAIIRAAILDALESDDHAEIQEDTNKGTVAAGRAQEEEGNRYACAVV